MNLRRVQKIFPAINTWKSSIAFDGTTIRENSVLSIHFYVRIEVGTKNYYVLAVRVKKASAKKTMKGHVIDISRALARDSWPTKLVLIATDGTSIKTEILLSAVTKFEKVLFFEIHRV